jgi:hypothetical protein
MRAPFVSTPIWPSRHIPLHHCQKGCRRRSCPFVLERKGPPSWESTRRLPYDLSVSGGDRLIGTVRPQARRSSNAAILLVSIYEGQRLRDTQRPMRSRARINESAFCSHGPIETLKYGANKLAHLFRDKYTRGHRDEDGRAGFWGLLRFIRNCHESHNFSVGP